VLTDYIEGLSSNGSCRSEYRNPSLFHVD
jgi:hypothetical protein